MSDFLENVDGGHAGSVLQVVIITGTDLCQIGHFLLTKRMSINTIDSTQITKG